MDNPHPFRLPKSQRLCSRKAQERLFGAGQKSLSSPPLRLVFHPSEQPGVRILVSVPKRHFKHAVCRNRITRQVREAYRLNKQLFQPSSADAGLDIAFLWTSPTVLTTEEVQKKMQWLLSSLRY